ncbi:ornithine cyclodeaminase family protein [Alphaproteobacteria bacterium GH1-50]|uniref:Ornithine cyclodeaminase family protein n=1 Tax=Kangsaoukella pontilimi TaxID=2691042 RepID=A0A7C9MGL7_9RHOB|nr:ornithine cyclodeaminase family protein [Kangsaoukella pontilimi]MXQ09632.1 ornithine cyclodeaminase family protein [Kangsaoukella pontilimi]
MGTLTYLSDDDLQALGIGPADIADAIERALIDKAEGRLHTAPKAAILPGGGRYVMSTLAVGGGLTVVKTVTVSPDNAAHGLPSINGAIQAYDAETGLLKAVLDANWITAVRTAGLSSVAARRLADPASESIAFVGTGVQAQSHLDAFAALFPLSRVVAYGRGGESQTRLLEKARAMGLDAEAESDPNAAIAAADIVVTSVPLDYEIEPFLDAGSLRPRTFAAITDLTIPWHDKSLSAFGTLVVDDLEQERSAPRPMVPAETIAGDLTDLVAGRIATPEDDAPRAFAFRGISLGDYAVTRLALERAGHA